MQGVTIAAKQALSTIEKINALFAQDMLMINTLGKARFSVILVFEHLKKLPQVSVAVLSQDLGISTPTARAALVHLEQLNIVVEMTGKERNRTYVYKKYLDFLEQGAEPL